MCRYAKRSCGSAETVRCSDSPPATTGSFTIPRRSGISAGNLRILRSSTGTRFPAVIRNTFTTIGSTLRRKEDRAMPILSLTPSPTGIFRFFPRKKIIAYVSLEMIICWVQYRIFPFPMKIRSSWQKNPWNSYRSGCVRCAKESCFPNGSYWYSEALR